jgi:hypothetical protein
MAKLDLCEVCGALATYICFDCDENKPDAIALCDECIAEFPSGTLPENTEGINNV